MVCYENIEYASLSDVGVRRSHNQDAYAIVPAGDAEQWQSRGHLFLVADGMGAHAVGELASKLAVDAIPHIYAKHAQEGPLVALRRSFLETNVTIHTRGQQNRDFQGMGTTATALLLRPEGAWIAHVGDSRAYRVRAGSIEQLSFDHSLVWELARRQHISPNELQHIPSNVIVRSLGPEPLVQIDIEGPHPLESGDLFLLCSDGLTGPVSDREIGVIVSVLPPAEACRLLVDLANLQGGPDNITVLIVRVGEVAPRSGAPRAAASPASATWYERLPWPLLALFLGIVLALGAIALTYNDWPGGMPMFLLATIALVCGMVGLLVQSHADKSATEPPPEMSPLRVHRRETCAIDLPYVQRIAKALSTLETRIREQGWEASWSECRRHEEEAERRQKSGELTAACREYCRAMHVLTEAYERYRPRGEIFKPLWETMVK